MPSAPFNPHSHNPHIFFKKQQLCSRLQRGGSVRNRGAQLHHPPPQADLAQLQERDHPLSKGQLSGVARLGGREETRKGKTLFSTLFGKSGSITSTWPNVF